jgi:hypothetical protein
VRCGVFFPLREDAFIPLRGDTGTPFSMGTQEDWLGDLNYTMDMWLHPSHIRGNGRMSEDLVDWSNDEGLEDMPFVLINATADSVFLTLISWTDRENIDSEKNKQRGGKEIGKKVKETTGLV